MILYKATIKFQLIIKSNKMIKYLIVLLFHFRLKILFYKKNYIKKFHVILIVQ